MSVHISDSNSDTQIALHNLLCRILYIWKLGWHGATHNHTFKSWTGARNLLCWCGAVQKLNTSDIRWVHVNTKLYGYTARNGLVRKIDESDAEGLAQAGIRRSHT